MSYYIASLDNISLDEIININNIYTDISEAKYDLNFLMCKTILRDFSIVPNNEFLFIHTGPFLPGSENTSPLVQIFEINKEKSLKFVKNPKKNGVETIQVFLENNNNGFIYNSKECKMIYKFFLSEINKCINKDLLETDNEDIGLLSEFEPVFPPLQEPLKNSPGQDFIDELKKKIEKIKIE